MLANVRCTLNGIHDIEINVVTMSVPCKVKDWVGVYMPPPPDCPEMKMPVRIAQASNVDEKNETIDVGYFFPKDGTHDGRFEKWMPAVAGTMQILTTPDMTSTLNPPLAHHGTT